MKKVFTLVGTRPELIRLAALIHKLDTHPKIQHVFVHTGQNGQPYLKDIFFKELNLREPNYVLQAQQLYKSTSREAYFQFIETILIKEQPSLFLVLGDTYSALAVIVAKKLNIPIMHLEAGNRCYDPNSPEENNRRFIDQIADYNGCYSEEAQAHLVEENMLQSSWITGSPLREVYDPFRERIKVATVLSTLKLKPKDYFVWSTHRAENLRREAHDQSISKALIALAQTYPSIPIIVTMHPRLKDAFSTKMHIFPPSIQWHEPFGLVDYLSLMKHAKVVLSDSGSINEEADILGFHAINLRASHERDEAEKIPVTMMSHFNLETIFKAIRLLDETPILSGRVFAYSKNDFSSRVMEKIKAILFTGES